MKAKELWAELAVLEKNIADRFAELVKDGKEYNFILPMLPEDFKSDDVEDMWEEFLSVSDESALISIDILNSYTGQCLEYHLLCVDSLGITAVQIGESDIEYGFRLRDIANVFSKIDIINEMETL